MLWGKVWTGQVSQLPYAQTQDNEIRERAHRWNEDKSTSAREKRFKQAEKREILKAKQSRYSLAHEGN